MVNNNTSKAPMVLAVWNCVAGVGSAGFAIAQTLRSRDLRTKINTVQSVQVKKEGK